MSLNIDIEEWKKGIPQRELEQKIREYEEDYPKREKMTPQARENNQTRFFLEDRFYELHKQQLADMLKKQAEENVLSGFGTDNQGIIPIAKDSSSERDGFSVGGGLEASALTPASYGATGGNGGQQLAGGYGNGYTADYVQPAVAAEKGQSMHTFYNEILPKRKVTRKVTVKEAIGDLPKCMPIFDEKNHKKRQSHNIPECNITWHIPRYANLRDMDTFKVLAEDIASGRNEYDSKKISELYEEKIGSKSPIHRYHVLSPNEPSTTIIAHLYKDGFIMIPNNKEQLQ